MSGKRQRPAYFQNDQKNSQHNQQDNSKKQEEVDSPDKISQRKIYKIKNQDELNKQPSSSKPNFTLFDNSNVQLQKPKNVQKDNHQSTNGQKKEQNKTIFGMFNNNNTSNIFSGNNGIGLFSKSEGLFSSNNIFAKKDPAPSDGNANAPNISNSIFGTTQSIFNFSSNGVPPIKKQTNNVGKNDDENDSGDSAELQKNQKQEIDPKKSTGTYKYENQCQVILQKKLLKFKRGEGDVVQNTEVVIQQDAQKKNNWIVVRIVATKHPILTGFLMKGKCDIKKMGSKQQNVTLSVVVVKDKIPERVILKLQFETPECGRQFTQNVQKLIK